MNEPLAIFPGAGFESSLLTAILVGLVVALVLHETLGWSFTGVVVPGYLAAVFLARPLSGMFIIIEAALTYGLVKLFVASGGRLARVGPLIGRDRFLALLVTSVVVRLGLEGWGFAALARLAGPGASLLDDGSGLYAVGLVVVPLAANVLWTPGWRRGGLQIGVSTGLAYACLYVLLRSTNLQLGDFEQSLEAIATNFAASPKAYIVLLLTAALAAHGVRQYGWDVGGILVPGLLAIAWLTPAKAAATLVEVGVVLLLVQPLRALGWVRGAHASRRLAIAFALLYLTKLGVAALIGRASVLQVTDLFGMGYVLPALLVEKIWARGSVARVLAPTVLLSLLGVFAGVGASLLVDRLLPAAPVGEGRLIERTGSLEEEALAALTRLADERPTALAPRPSAAELVQFHGALRAVARGRTAPAVGAAARLGLQVTRLSDQGAIVLAEVEQPAARRRGFGTVIVWPERSGPLLELLEPDALTLLAAVRFSALLDATALSVAGVAPNSQRGDPATESMTPAAVVRQVLAAERPILRLRRGAAAQWRGELPEAWRVRLAGAGVDGLPGVSGGAREAWLSEWAVNEGIVWPLLARGVAEPALVDGAVADAVLAEWAKGEPQRGRPSPLPVAEVLATACAAPTVAAVLARAAGWRLQRLRPAEAELLWLTESSRQVSLLSRRCGSSPVALAARGEPAAVQGEAWVSAGRFGSLLLTSRHLPATAVGELLAPLVGPGDPPLWLLCSAGGRASAEAVGLAPVTAALGADEPPGLADAERQAQAWGVATVRQRDGEVWAEVPRAWARVVGQRYTAVLAALPATDAMPRDTPLGSTAANLLPIVVGSVSTMLAALPTGVGPVTPAELDAWRELASQFVRRADPGALRVLERRVRVGGAGLLVWRPPGFGEHLVAGAAGDPPRLVLVALAAAEGHRRASTPSAIDAYLNGRAASLILTGEGAER